jgi:hypothetical protein
MFPFYNMSPSSSSSPENPTGYLGMVHQAVGIRTTLEIDHQSPTLSSHSPVLVSNGGGLPRRQISNVSLPQKKSGIGGASANLVNSIVGAGIIGIPYALKESGLVAGVCLLCLVAYCTGEFFRFALVGV